jgi:hypothetical protein
MAEIAHEKRGTSISDGVSVAIVDTVRKSFKAMPYRDDDQNNDELRRPIREMAARVREWRFYLMTRGLDAKEFLDASAALEKVLDGDAPAEGVVERFTKTIDDFVVKLGALADYPPKFSREEKIKWITASRVFELEEGMNKMVSDLAGTPDDPRLAVAKEFRKRLSEAVRGAGDFREVMEDLYLWMNTELGDVNRRIRFRNAAVAMYWEQMPQEKWDSLSPDDRAKLFELLELWRKERESLLGELPIADRRRLEAMEHYRPEDWENPGNFTV